ncbi:MAG: primosomal protein N' [Dermabacter sp.]|nr:primosomal protein N' [Dermabacter sp.]
MNDGLFPPVEGAASRAANPALPPGGADGEPSGPPFALTSGFEVAEVDPVARVHVFGVLPHLDRLFEYAVPASLAHVVPGQRVRVQFSGRDREALVRSRHALPETTRPLAPLKALVSEDVVIDESMFRLCEDVAARYAGSVTDVLRLAVPPRSAAAEASAQARREKDRAEAVADADSVADAESEDAAAREDAPETEDPPAPERLYATKYPGLAAFLGHATSREGATPRASIVLDPVDAWCALAVEAVGALNPDQGAIILASDQRDVERAQAAFAAAGIDALTLSSAAGPQRRYSAFLSILDGRARVVIGTRSAAFAPVKNLALILVWDPDDDLYEEPRAPYPHARTVALSRSYLERAGVLFLAPTASAFLRSLEHRGTLVSLPARPVPRTGPYPYAATHPRVELMDEYLREREGAAGYSRLPRLAYQRIREGLRLGPVLVHVPRSGWAPSLACTFCGTRASCLTCHALLPSRGRGEAVLTCRVCSRSHAAYRCPECARTEFRPLVLGSSRTAEDLRRAFPEARLLVSGGAEGVVPDAEVSAGTIVVATPGAEPLPEAGYAAALIVDADQSLARATYDADTEAVRRFSHVIAATRTFADQGQVLVLCRAPHPALRSLVQPRSFAFIDAVLTQRAELMFPPTTKVVEVSGDREACERWLAHADLGSEVGIFGPTEMDAEGSDGGEARTRIIVRAPIDQAPALVAAVRASALVHSAKKIPGQLRIQVDPPHVF